MSNATQDSILHSSTIYKNAVNYYYGYFKVSDNKLTEELLTKITSNNSSVKENRFYFYIFNQICLKSDGALSEILGKYCLEFMLKNTEFILTYFQKNLNVEKKYAEFVGYEFYFKEYGTSDIKYNYKEFKELIIVKIEGKKKYKKILSLFYKDIENVMKNMD